MSNEAVVAVLLRLAGIFIALYLLQFIAGFVLSATSAGAMPIYLIGFGHVVIWTLFAGALIVAPDRIARAVLPGRHAGAATASWSIDEFQAACFSVVGVFVLAFTLTDLSVWLRGWQAAASMVAGRPEARMGTFDWLHFGTALARIAAGVWLLFGASGLRRVIQSVRRAGAG